jgi:hypothetical protein
MSSILKQLCALLLSIMTLSACNKYIDVTKTERRITVLQGQFILYPDSNILSYKSNVYIKMEEEKLKPKRFTVKLPKKIKFYNFSNSQDFCFFYDNKQSIYIKVDLQDNKLSKDTIYTPSEREINNLIQTAPFSNGTKYILAIDGIFPGRKQTIIKRGSATVLLYNIKEKNLTSFFEQLNTFRFE